MAEDMCTGGGKNLAMLGKAVFLSLLLFTLVFPAASGQSGERTVITIELSEDDSAHVTLEVIDARGLDELRPIITDPSIAATYKEQLIPIFGEVEGLEISIKSSSMVMEFDSNLAEKGGGKLVVDRVDFNGRLSPVSIYKMVLPGGYKLLDADPNPAEVEGNVLYWHDVDYVPGMVVKKSSLRGIIMGIAIIVLVVVLLAKRNTLLAKMRNE